MTAIIHDSKHIKNIKRLIWTFSHIISDVYCFIVSIVLNVVLQYFLLACTMRWLSGGHTTTLLSKVLAYCWLLFVVDSVKKIISITNLYSIMQQNLSLITLGGFYSYSKHFLWVLRKGDSTLVVHLVHLCKRRWRKCEQDFKRRRWGEKAGE